MLVITRKVNESFLVGDNVSRPADFSNLCGLPVVVLSGPLGSLPRGIHLQYGGIMSLDFFLEKVQPCKVYSRNITHNLNVMAEAAGIYGVLWRPEENGIETAIQAVPHLEKGLELLKSDPERFQQYNSPNGWGTYPHFVKFVEDVLQACIENPDATVRACR